jgi:hypothetical protein
MSELAYDISYLLDSEPPPSEAPAPRITRMPAPAAAPPSAAMVQAAMARELLLVAEVHEEWIRQYLSVHGGAV